MMMFVEAGGLFVRLLSATTNFVQLAFSLATPVE
jgi:hypothetical protein